MTRLLFLVLSLVIAAATASARDANHLQGAKSPYLLQHLTNPVDWYPWGPEALAKARTEGKLIFISVGYSSCHWCHVMEEESFEDEAIAAFLNAHFVSIKIDRETRPDLDEQFMFVTQMLTGTGGWPNSVFLTPEGDPFHAGGYFPPEEFRGVLQKVEQAWRDNPGFINGEARRVTQAVTGYLGRKAEAREVTQTAVDQVAAGILEHMDPFNGGFGVAPKFPREPLFLFLMDHAARTGDAQALREVTAMLDGMILGGIHDHVGGGFHRYAIDPEWHVPHFEKMLYNQALMGRLLVRVWEMTGEDHYHRAATRLFDYVLRDMTGPEGGFFSAQDADSLNAAGEKVEGAYYTWAPDDLAALGPAADEVAEQFQISPEGDLDGGNVLHLLDQPEDLADLDKALSRLMELRRTRPEPFLDRKILVSWNAMMIATLAEAGWRMKRPDYLQAAEKATRFLLDRMIAEQGLSRVYYEGEVQVAGQLADYAGLALALIALHDHTTDQARAQDWLKRALGLAEEIRKRFGSAETGYRMTETRDGLSDVVPVDDADIPSGNALALTLFARLSQRMQVPEIEQEAYRLAAALSGHALSQPDQRGYALKAIQELQHGQTGPLRHVANGAVRVDLVRDRDNGEILVDIAIAEGWHINAHQPLEDFFIATDLSLAGMPELSVDYPAPEVKTLSFNDTPLALYEGELRLSVRPGALSGDTRVNLTLQACSDEICLQPETLVFTLWPG